MLANTLCSSIKFFKQCMHVSYELRLEATHVHLCAYACEVCMNVWMYGCMYICTFVCMNVPMYACIDVPMYIHA
jgi:hypothetical protein